MKKKIVICMVITLIVIGSVISIAKIVKNGMLKEEEGAKWRKQGWLDGEYPAYVLSTKFPTDIIWYGSWEGYRFEVPVRLETEVTPEILKPRKGYEYVYIVIDDTEGKSPLSEEDYKMIVQYVKNDSRYRFIYAGNQLELIAKCGIGRTEYEADEFSVAAFYYPGAKKYVTCYRIWNRSDIETEEQKMDTSYVHYSFADNAFQAYADHMPED